MRRRAARLRGGTCWPPACSGAVLTVAPLCRGRYITSKGQRELDVVAGQVIASKVAKKVEKADK